MDWTADKIKRLRAAAGMTQRQLALWLGVTTMQVQHLENERRNPGGPVERLLDILARRVKAGETSAIHAELKEIESTSLKRRNTK